MKAKDFIIIGGAIALYYLYQKNKSKTSSTSAEEEAQDEATPSGGAGGGGGMPMPIVTTPVKATPVKATPVKVKGGTTSGGEAIFTGAIIPIIPRPNIVATPIRSITNPAPIETPIEEAIQVGGASTIPRPIIPIQPSVVNENELINQHIQPIVRTTRSLSKGVLEY